MTPIPTGAAARLASVEMPMGIAKLARDKRGYPIPSFIDRKADKPDGEPDFRIMDGKFMLECIKYNLCWICGGFIGAIKTFPIGPMCAINRNIAEPPSHLDCCRYSAKVCPFLAIPEMRRIEVGKPEGTRVSGEKIARNPGAICLWTVKRYRVWKPKPGETLFDIGEPIAVEWWSRGRAATRVEVDASIASGLPFLEERAREQSGGMEALQEYIQRAQRYLPAETANG